MFQAGLKVPGKFLLIGKRGSERSGWPAGPEAAGHSAASSGRAPEALSDSPL